ncbi:26S proteasome non-ATPase regulatory subunit 7 [Chionoecetes opilio]|uniref:26S proteasome non-ATPase regulatory subunit 7 n=1 Tax=Chionoecetes opilio TaxID=41210 RepID=A0A8J4YHS2_CHIOP|nr:26S proteasome non-ATPase regulatory subunit 7 [Chionoecetes opilio]
MLTPHDGTPTSKTFEHVASEIGAEEAEEVGVEHLLRDIKDMFNLLPDVTNHALIKSLYVKTNDQMLVVYLASLIRSIIALHNLINNKLANTDAEKKEGKKEGGEKKGEDKDGKKEDKEKEEKEKKGDDKK